MAGNEFFNYVTSKLKPVQKFGNNEFWTASEYPSSQIKMDYALLNNLPGSIESHEIREKQLSVLEALNDKVNDNLNSRLNKMLFNDGYINSQNNGNGEMLLTDVIQNIMDNISTIRNMSRKSAGIDKQSMQTRYASTTQALAQIREIILSFSLNASGGISAQTLDTIDSLFKKLQAANPGAEKYQIRSFGTTEMKWILKNLNNIQGGLLEALGTEFLNERLPGNIDLPVKAIQSGVLQSMVNGKSTQIIQDIMVLNMNKVNLSKDVTVSYTLNKKKYTTSLIDFLNKIENYKGNSHFTLSDKTYELLESLSILNIQAKSGKNQRLWNKNVQNQIKLSDLTNPEDTWNGLSGAVVFQILEELNDVSGYKGIPYVATQDNGRYSDIANYALSSRLGQLLNFGMSTAQNQVLLTRKGFQSYISALIERIGSSGYVHFSQAINIERGMLDIGRNTSALFAN